MITDIHVRYNIIVIVISMTTSIFEIELIFIVGLSSAMTPPSRSSRKTNLKFNDSWNRGLAPVEGSDLEGRDERGLVTLICAGPFPPIVGPHILV